MDDEARRTKARQLVEALNARDLDWFDALYHDDVVIHWPQSGEVIRASTTLGRCARPIRPRPRPA
jgi:hypothetical protein